MADKMTKKYGAAELLKIGRAENVTKSIEARKNKIEQCRNLKKEEKAQLLDFVFGKTDINPLAVKVKEV